MSAALTTSVDHPTVPTLRTLGREDSEYLDDKKSIDDVAIAKEYDNHSSSYDDEAAFEIKGDDNDPAYNVLPQIVRELCDFEDDPSIPVLTWRFFFLSAIFTALGAWLTQMGFFRTTYIPYSIYFVQIASLFFGRFLAATLPQKLVGFGRFKFELNPGEFSVKEHVAVVLAANTGATNNLGDYVLAPLAVFYDDPMNGWIAILFMWSAVFIGFSYATLAKTFIIENPNTTFPLTLQQVSVFKAQRMSLSTASTTAKTQMRVFWYGILIFFLWEFLPEYIFPFTSSLAFLCWVTKNSTAQFLGSGLGGVGLLNVTLDWSNIGSTMIYYPWWTQLNMFASYVISAWILIPISYYMGIWESDKYPIQSQTLWMRNGTKYPTASLMNSDFSLNSELFAEVGPPMMSAQLRWGYFFSYVAWLGAFVSCILFQGPEIYRTVKLRWQRKAAFDDKLSQIIRQYPTVPIWWNLALFLVPFIILIAFSHTGLHYPPYMLYIGLVIGAVIVVPMSYIYSVTGYQVPVGYFNELFYGYAINLGGSRHPVGSLSYRVISGQCWYEAQAMLADMKLGHYFHIPPRATLIAQVWGILIGVPINYATILWVCKTKADVLSGAASDPNHQWTGQTVISLNNQGIAFGLIGPKLLFDDPMYAPMLYGFVAGAIVPIILWLIHKKWPKLRADLVNIPIFATTFENFYGNLSNYLLTWFVLGTINHMYFKRYRYGFWKKFAYLAGAAADTGYNFNMLFLFIAFSAVKTTSMPNWWGNNADSVERCFYLPDSAYNPPS
ncbi:OPT oligopeptide transporter [Stereum hirsutum FP-91666 SS1]|uniref:OPT oligopeptide transporter n=1 Tax=Stereum hirsutum (strain FP-91666) TaxID=721885 RepID=UPI000444A7BD|nr:OPT oligopeptide transporter [Stereum hirsutum FP-91666 SS1]EIM85355.1 OPT oligopeptide transporter [Stereum hirsutum FP-91666 SS1]